MNPPSDPDDAKQALRQAEEALARALREKADFEAIMRERISEHAHDIKSALGPVVGYAQILQGGQIDPKSRERYLETILRATMRAVDICNSMMGGAAASANDDDPEALQVVDIAAMIEEVVEQFSAMAGERKVALKSDILPGFPEINSIPQHIYRSLTNVITNAIKFTPAGGEVTIKAELDPAENAVVLVVRDTGAGIPLEQILDIMKSGQTTVSPHGDKGNGLGLGIVNKLLAELGGALDIESRPGQGTTISLKFPKLLHAQAA
jgi:signal transduction histidine kinase